MLTLKKTEIRLEAWKQETRNCRMLSKARMKEMKFWKKNYKELRIQWRKHFRLCRDGMPRKTLLIKFHKQILGCIILIKDKEKWIVNLAVVLAELPKQSLSRRADLLRMQLIDTRSRNV